jgi:CO/xanthine dehydrogenase Mo-binding subunit
MEKYLIGKPIPRKEGRKKVTGQALYVDDSNVARRSVEI